MTEEQKNFLKRKNVILSPARYLKDSMSAMGVALFSSIVVGLIFKTMGEEFANRVAETPIAVFFMDAGNVAIALMGPAIGVAIAYTLEAPMLVVVCTAIVGQMGAEFTGFGIDVPGGPGGAFLASIVGCEFGKLVYQETRFDNLVTPTVALVTGGVAAKFAGPLVGLAMKMLGSGINATADWHPFISSIIISVVVGLLLTFPPVSSAAFCIMLDLSGIAAGAATVGCCAQMMGFAVCGHRTNGFPGWIMQGIGTSMLQMPNIIKKPLIWVPPTLTAAIMGPISACIFHMTNNAEGAGMGTSGLVGQLMTLTDMGFTMDTFGKIVLLHMILPVTIAFIINEIMIKAKLIDYSDYDLHILRDKTKIVSQEG